MTDDGPAQGAGTFGHVTGGGDWWTPLNFAVVSCDVAGSRAGASAQNITPLPSWSRIVIDPCGR